MAEHRPPEDPTPDPDATSGDSPAEHPAEIGGTDWLLEQLSGGRPPAPSDADQDAAADLDTAMEGRPAPDASAAGGAPADSSAGTPAADEPADAAATHPKLRWSWANEAIEEVPAGPVPARGVPARGVPAEVSPIEPPLFIDHSRTAATPIAPVVDDVMPPIEGGTSDENEGAENGGPEDEGAEDEDAEGEDAEGEDAPAPFFWGLTPGDGVDPLIYPELAHPEATPEFGAPASQQGVPDPQQDGATEWEHGPEHEPETGLPQPDSETGLPEPESETGLPEPESAPDPIRGPQQEPEPEPEPELGPELEPGPGLDPAEEPDLEPGQTLEPEQTPGLEPTPAPVPAPRQRQPQTRAERRRRDKATASSDDATTVVPNSPQWPAPLPAGSSSPAPVAVMAPRSTGGASGGGARASGNRSTRVLFWVAGALLLVLILIGLYVFGTQLPGMVGGAPASSPTASATKAPAPTPTPTLAATGPQAPGNHAWDSLRGGECLQPFTTPWAQDFTVVDCATPHAAQLVYVGVFSADAAAPFPGVEQLSSQINLLCTRPGIINTDVASQVSDAQIQGTYPAVAQQWKDGQRSYFCFVNRAGGEPLTGSIAGPGPS